MGARALIRVPECLFGVPAQHTGFDLLPDELLTDKQLVDEVGVGIDLKADLLDDVYFDISPDGTYQLVESLLL